MPVLNVESLDDPLLFDATGSFSGGMNSISAPRLLPEVASSELINVDIDKTGTAITRRGTASLSPTAIPEGTAYIQGMGFFNTLSQDKIVIAKNRKIYHFDSAAGVGSWTQEGSSYLTAYATDEVHFAQLEEKLFFCDGTSDLKYFDGTSVQSVNAGSGAPAAPKLIASHTNRLFAVPSGEPDTIYVSDILDAEGTSSWSVVQTIRIGGDGDPITAIFPWTGFRLLAFKRSSTYVINADPTDSIANWEIQAIDRSVGCIAPRSLAQVGADVYWLALDGVRSLRRTLAGTEQEISEPLSKPIDSIVQDINLSQANKSAGFYYLNRYILSFPAGSSEVPDTTVVFNTDFKTWSGKWTGFAGTCFARYTRPPNDDLCFGTPNGKVLRWRGNIAEDDEVDVDFTDDGDDIATSITSREFSFGDVVSLKSLYGIEIEFYGSTTSCDIQIIPDGGSAETVFSGIDTSNPQLNLPFVLNTSAILGSLGTKRRGRDLSGRSPVRGVQVKLSSTSGKLAIRSIVLSSFIESYRPQVL
ncbi:MAG: hypothetical protein EBZ69_01290 [Alphaproteobacteria bacterium]|nr:hypothetical protein [Alphaproteobacteria bacterium]